MEIKKVICEVCEENCYILHNGCNAVIIDAGSDEDAILKACEGLSITHILLTHCHYDHIASAESIKKKTSAKIVCGRVCNHNLKDNNINLSTAFGVRGNYEDADITLADGEILSTSVCDIKCIETPGHTDCSVCFMIGDKLFSGDTLFKLSVGRYDLPGGNVVNLRESVMNKLYSLDENIRVYPGHGEFTEIGYEKKHNLFFKADN